MLLPLRFKNDRMKVFPEQLQEPPHAARCVDAFLVTAGNDENPVHIADVHADAPAGSVVCLGKLHFLQDSGFIRLLFRVGKPRQVIDFDGVFQRKFRDLLIIADAVNKSGFRLSPDLFNERFFAGILIYMPSYGENLEQKSHSRFVSGP